MNLNGPVFMEQVDKRQDPRINTILRGVVSGLNDLCGVDCAIRDISTSGCKIVSSRVSFLPEQVLLTVEGLNRPVKSKLVWRETKTAGLKFIWNETDE